MGSGPRAGLSEIFLPELQKGSSIMPGKVNPVIPEVVTQVSAQVIGNDTAITVGGMNGHFELNVYVPLIARNLLQSIDLLANTSRLFAERCVAGIEANRERNEQYAESTLSAATALNPFIGYDKASEIVKGAAASGRSLREVAREAGVEESVLDEALDYHKMAKPHGAAAPSSRGTSVAARTRASLCPAQCPVLSLSLLGTNDVRRRRVGRTQSRQTGTSPLMGCNARTTSRMRQPERRACRTAVAIGLATSLEATVVTVGCARPLESDIRTNGQ